MFQKHFIWDHYHSCLTARWYLYHLIFDFRNILHSSLEPFSVIWAYISVSSSKKESDAKFDFRNFKPRFKVINIYQPIFWPYWILNEYWSEDFLRITVSLVTWQYPNIAAKWIIHALKSSKRVVRRWSGNTNFSIIMDMYSNIDKRFTEYIYFSISGSNYQMFDTVITTYWS